MGLTLAIGLYMGVGSIAGSNPVNGAALLMESGGFQITEGGDQLIAEYTAQDPLLMESGGTQITEGGDTLLAQ